MTKIKKILETVCHNCGKILVDEVSYPTGMAAVVLCSLLTPMASRATQDLWKLYVTETLKDASMRFGGLANLR